MMENSDKTEKVATRKQRYHSPELLIYGSIADLTNGTPTGQLADGQMKSNDKTGL